MKFFASISGFMLQFPVLLVALASGHAVAQTDARIELQEMKATLMASAAKIQELEQKLAQSNAQSKALSESLASANSECNQARENHEKLRLQLEGLGVAALDPTNTELQQRLLSALSDLRILEGHRRILTESLVGLSEAALAYAKTASNRNADAAEGLNNALATAEKALGGSKLKAVAPGSDAAALDNAKVVSLKEDLGVAVFNVGSRSGVHPGMPFSIYRKDKPVARALVVDVRQGVCGAVIQNLVSNNDPVKVGDTGRVETSKG